MSVAYQLYLLSAHWGEVRKRALFAAGNCCEFCGWPDDLRVHHLTYDRLGTELLDDVIVLCASCHGDVHEFPKRKAEVAGFAARRDPERETKRYVAVEEAVDYGD